MGMNTHFVTEQTKHTITTAQAYQNSDFQAPLPPPPPFFGPLVIL